MSNSLWAFGLYSPWNSPDQNTGVGGLSLLQGIFPTQGSNPGLPHCRWILYQLSYHSVDKLKKKSLQLYGPPASWAPKFLIRNWEFTEDPLCAMSHFFLVAFKVLSLSFAGLLVIYLGILVWLSFELILLGVCWASLMFVFIFHQIWKFSAIISSSILSTPFCSSLGTPTVHVSLLNCVLRCLRLCSFFYNLFSFYSSDLIISIVQSLVHWFFLWPAPIYFWIFFFCSGSFFFN